MRRRPKWMSAIGGLSAAKAVGAGRSSQWSPSSSGSSPVRHRRHRRSGTGRGGEYGAVPDLRVGHADPRGAYLENALRTRRQDR